MTTAHTPAELVPAPPADTPISLEVRQRAITMAALKDRIEVTNSVQYEHALDEQKKIRDEIDAITTSYDAVIAPRRKVLDAWYEDKRALLKPLQDADGIIGRKALDWRAAEDRKAELERQRLQKIADDDAEAERRRELAAREKEIAKAAKAGNTATVRELKQEMKAVAASPVVARTVQVDSKVPDVAGMAVGDAWKIDAEKIDLIRLAEAVYRGWCSPKAIEPAAKFLGQQARSLEKEFNVADPKTKRTPFPGVVSVNAGKSSRT